MEYEINVAKPNGMNWNGTEIQYVHFFRVQTDYGKYEEVYKELKAKFPDCKIDVYQVKRVSRQIEMGVKK